MSRTNNCRTVMYTLPQIYMCKVWKLSLVVVVQKLYVGLGVYNPGVPYLPTRRLKMLPDNKHVLLCKILSTRGSCVLVAFPFQCCALLTFNWATGGNGALKNLKPRWPPASFFNHRPRGLLTHKQATSQCWFLQATWEPASLWPKGFFCDASSWAWLPDLLGTK